MSSPIVHPDLSGWVRQVELEVRGAKNITLGIANGDRHSIDRRVLDQLARNLAGNANGNEVRRKLLIVRVRDEDEASRLDRRSPGKAPTLQAIPSPLGSWSVVDLRIGVRDGHGQIAQQVASELPRWKQDYRLILIDLGSIGGRLSRELGYFCDRAYIVLGPDSCGAPEWLRLQIGRHEQAGSQVCGTITVDDRQAA